MQKTLGIFNTWELSFLGWVWWAASPSSRFVPWHGGERCHHSQTLVTSPKVLFFFMGAEKIAFSQPFYWQYHRITECFGLERILKMIQGLTVVGGIPSFQGTLSRIISIFYEPQSCSSTAGVFYFLLLYLFSFTS